MNDILIRRGLGALLGATLILLASKPASARTVYLLDFDGTITDDQSERSTWRTPWILQRIDNLRNLLQLSPEPLPQTLELSYKEYRRLASKLGRGAGALNASGKETLDFDPLAPDRELTITPGHYAVDDETSFKYYREASGRRSFLVRDLRAALKRTEVVKAAGGEGDWRGPAFPLVQRALAQSDTAENLMLFTARHHAQPEWRRFLEVLKEEGLVNSVPKSLRVYSMSAPESIAFARDGIGAKKAEVLGAVAIDLLNRSDRHAELAPDRLEAEAGQTRDVHTLIVGEDDPRYLNALRLRMQALSGDLHLTHRIKFVLLNAGSDADVAEAYWPWRYTVIHKGMGRPATADEIALWTGAGCEASLR